MGPRSGLLTRVGRPELLVSGMVAAVVLGGAAFAGSLVVAAMTATGVLGTGSSLWLLLALLSTVLATGFVAAGATAWLAWLALGELRAATRSGWRRLLWTGYRRARTFEDRSLLGRLLRPTRLFVDRGDGEGHLVEELKSRYVAGAVDEAGFERELGRLLGGGVDAGEHVRREIEVTAADGGSNEGSTPTAEERSADGERATADDRHRDVSRGPERELETG